MPDFESSPRAHLRATLMSAAALFLVVSTFHWVAGGTVIMPHVSAFRLVRYGVALHGQDHLVAALAGWGAMAAAAFWRRGYWAVVALLVVMVLVRLVQYDALANTGEYLSPDALAHADLLYVFVTPAIVARYLLAAALVAAAGLGLALLFRRAGGPGESPALGRRRRLIESTLAAAAMLVLWGGFWLSTSHARRASWEKLFAVDPRSPEVALLATLARHLAPPAPVAPVPPLRAGDVTALAGFGIDVDPAATFPWQRAGAWGPPLPRVAGVDPALRPNVLVIFFESLSARLLAHPAPGLELAPSFARAKVRGFAAERYYNHTTPTALGLVGQLCSFYPVCSHEDWLASVWAARPSLRCLPHLLTEAGYHTAYLGHGQPRFTRLRDQLALTGFAEQRFGAEVAESLLGRPAEEPDRTDHEMLEAAWQWMAARADHDAPFFLAVSTFDFHMPFALPADAPPAPTELPVPLRILHSTDHALGGLLERLGASPLAADTLVVLTADHAVLPQRELVEFLRDDPDFNPGAYDRIPLLILDPVHALPERTDRLANSTDLAPTLAQLLSLDAPQAFMGWSLFGARERSAGLFGTHASLGFVLDATVDPPRPTFFAADGPPASAEPPVIGLYRRFFAWHRGLVANGRIWPGDGALP